MTSRGQIFFYLLSNSCKGSNASCNIGNKVFVHDRIDGVPLLFIWICSVWFGSYVSIAYRDFILSMYHILPFKRLGGAKTWGGEF